MRESLVLFAQQVVETLGGEPQPDAVLARQMQALSLAVHIPIVCFGIAFPAMFLFVEGLYLRTGDADLQGARQALVEGRADRCSPSAS